MTLTDIYNSREKNSAKANSTHKKIGFGIFKSN